MKGLNHIYCGDGKGKTTAAVGLAVRAAGAGKRVLFVQFFKNGTSSEIGILSAVPGIETAFCPDYHGLYKYMDEQAKDCARADYSALLDSVMAKAGLGFEMLVLDDIISASNHSIISAELLLSFLKNKPEGLEVVLTGRDPSRELLELGDYVTEMRKVKHPYDKGIKAREGVEY